MKKISKKVALGLAAVAFATFGAVGVGTLELNAKTLASADNATMNVDTLGNLEWEAVSGATGYNWSYTVGSETSATYSAESNEANVVEAIMTAVNAAKADGVTAGEQAQVTFNVTPEGVANATTQTWTYTFDKYINYGYSTHDISDVDAAYENDVSVTEMSMWGLTDADTVDDANKGIWQPSTVYKNDLLTLGFKTEVALQPTYGVSFFLFLGHKSVGDKALATQCNYAIRVLPGGGVCINNREKNAFLAGDFTATASSDYNTPIVVGARYYLSMGVFDTYDLSGETVGETVYFDRSVYDESKDTLVSVGGLSGYYSNADIEAAGAEYEMRPEYGVRDITTAYEAENEDGTKTVKYRRYVPVERSAFAVKAQGTYDKDGDGTKEVRNFHVYLFSGKPDYKELDEPTGVYYDNVDATLNWNRVDGADGYEWKHGGSAWQSASVNKVDVSALLTEYDALGYLPLYVRAVKGETKGATARYNLDLVTFYKTRSTLKDITELYAFSSSPDTSYNVNKENGAGNGGDGFDASGLTLNTHTTFAFTTNETTPDQSRFISLGLFGESKPYRYQGRFNLALWGDGTVFLTPSWPNTTILEDNRQLKRFANWRVMKITDGFKPDVKYYVTFGVDEIWNDETKIADRVTLRIEEETDDGLSRNTIGTAFYDYKYYNVAEGSVVTEVERDGEGAFVKVNVTDVVYGQFMQLGAHSDVVSLWQAKNTNSSYKLVFAAGEEAVAEETVSYGELYDFSEVMANVAVDGYVVNGWEYKNGDKTEDFLPYGVWNKTVDGGALLIEADLAPIPYKITYSGLGSATHMNPTVYTIEANWALATPRNIPEGKVFDGWYEASDTTFSDPITSLKGRTGAIELVARFVDGYTITVDGQAHTWKTTDEAFTLVAPTVTGKTFVKWQVLDGNAYVDYTGETTFTPTASASFRTVYDWTTYTIAYVADGGAHESATSYTAETPVALKNATKQGYFFAGWYTEATFETRVTSTGGFAENLTLYAKFMQDTIPTAISLDTNDEAQVLPVPELPDGSQYTVELYAGEQKLDASDGAYMLTTAGEYTIKYAITLPTGETVNREVALTVKQVYTVTVHYGDGETLTIKKYAGEKLTEAELPETPEDVIFGGLYTDAQYTNAFDLDTEISADTNIYVKWTENAPADDGGSNLGWIIGGIAGGVVLIGVGVAVFFVLKKKRNNKKIDD